MISKWDAACMHFLVETYPPKVNAPWQMICSIQDIPEEDWKKDISLSSILKETGHIYWQEQRISAETCSALAKAYREKSLEHIVIGNVFDDAVHIARITNTDFNSVRELFHSSDRAKMQFFFGVEPKMEVAPPPRLVSQTLIEQYYIELPHPSTKTARMYLGTGEKLHSYSPEGREIWFMSQKFSDKELVVRPEIVAAYILAMKKPAFNKNLLSQEYYAQNSKQYALWSYDLHKRQVEECLVHVPPHTVVVAPGDGAGVVTDTWTGEVYSGDPYPSSDRVRKENMIATIMRATRDLRLRKTNGLLIASYITSLLSEAELDVLKSWSGPVMWIDAHNKCPFVGAQHISHGVFFKNCPPEWHRIVVCSEPWAGEQHIPYSENLLRLEKVTYHSVPNKSVQYWQAMRPFATTRPWNPENRNEVVVCHDLQEFIQCYSPRANIYLTSVGKIVEEVSPFRVTLGNAFKWRHVYQIPLDNPLQDWLISKSHYAIDQARQIMWFCFTYERHIEEEVVVLGDRFSVIVSEFSQMTVLPPFVVVSAHPDKRAILVKTLYGLQRWQVTNEFTRELVSSYIQVYSGNYSGWLQLLSEFELDPYLPQDDDLHRYYVIAKEYWDKIMLRKPTPFRSPLYWFGDSDETFPSYVTRKLQMQGLPFDANKLKMFLSGDRFINSLSWERRSSSTWGVW
jgi:hypothetical protein